MDRWKKLLRKEIIKCFPKEDFTKYVEVFGGAGWVLFDKVQSKKQLEVFNDI
ncbi:DNA adenine methylase, partial [Thomasclavelia ramosa]